MFFNLAYNFLDIYFFPFRCSQLSYIFGNLLSIVEDSGCPIKGCVGRYVCEHLSRDTVGRFLGDERCKKSSQRRSPRRRLGDAFRSYLGNQTIVGTWFKVHHSQCIVCI
jgi:hypothetical protein